MNNNTTHTPGPWYTAQKGDYNTDGIDVWAYNRSGLSCNIACVRYMGTASYMGAEQNANLIAAAPEMLEALRGMLEWARRAQHANPGPEIVHALNAISKAEGV